MSDETTPPAGDEATPPADVQVTPPAAQPDATPLGTVDQLPDWAQKLVKELRQENASHRKAKTDAEKAAQLAAEKAAADQGEFKRLYEEAKGKLEVTEARAKAAELAHLKAKVGNELKLPSSLVDRLRGETEDELRADATALIAALPKPAASTDAGAGLGGGQQPAQGLTDDQIKEMAARYGVSFRHLKETMVKNN